MNKKIQNIRSEVIYSSREAAIAALEGLGTSVIDDGVTAVARYKIGDGPVISVEAIYHVDADNTVTPTILNYDTLDKDLTVLGVTVGALTSGTVIHKGTTVEEILRMILIKEIDVTSVAPTTVLTGITTQTVEVGTKLTNALGHTYTDGQFKGQTGYTYNVNAGCTEGTTTYYVGGSTTVTSPLNYTVAYGPNSFTCKTTYAASTVTPKKNNGNDSAVKIAAGAATSAAITVTGAYNAYYGWADTSVNDGSESSFWTSANIKTYLTPVFNSNTLIGGTAVTSNGGSIVIACPPGKVLKTIQDGNGTNIIGQFSSPTNVTVTMASTATGTYKLYIYPFKNGQTNMIKNATIG